MITVAAAAVTYAEKFGWHIFPRHPDKAASFKSKKFSDGAPWGATNDPERVKHDFECWPQARIGARAGFLPGVCVPLSSSTPTPAPAGMPMTASRN